MNSFYIIVNITFLLAEAILEDHYRGKKHRKMQEAHGGGGSKISRTLRVRNFPRIPFIDNEIWAYFERYGPVEDVYVEYRSFVSYVGMRILGLS